MNNEISFSKIRALKFLEDASGFPRSARVDFGADYDSDESDQEEGMDKLQKKTEDEYESCSRKIADNNTNKETSSRTSDSKRASENRKSILCHKIVGFYSDSCL